MNDRITITINRDGSNQLKKEGSFGVTYSELILRLIKTVDSISRGSKEYDYQ